MAHIDDSALQKIITGRVEPYIYSFETNTLPNLLKVGDTYRPVEERLNEWRRLYKDLAEVSRDKAVINDGVFFRDHSIHKYLRNNGITQVPINPSLQIHSREFFESIGKADVSNAVADVIANYGVSDKYEYYSNLKERVEYHFKRTADFKPRDNQQEVINNFTSAVNNGRTNLLMYAVMRFGKSVTSMWSAKAINSKLTIVVSAKKDVRDEWKQTVESHKDFEGYRFMDSSDLKSGISFDDIFGTEFQTGSGDTEICTNIVLFLTLQDLSGSIEAIKEHHEILQKANPDLLIIDETHFGARAQVLGKILAGVSLIEEDDEALKINDGIDELGQIKNLKPINAKVKLHLSGTPYRILMGSEFEEEDIIAFVQFSDIYESKLEWSAQHLEENEWDNPYYGFPQMIRFAFNPNESSRKKLEQMPGSKPSELFEPNSKTANGDYETFKYEEEVVDLLEALDGTKHDTQLLGLLDHESIKAGKLANHIVVVLPYRASCDALEKLIAAKQAEFKNLPEYTILNISGINSRLTKPSEIKSAISKAQSEGKKTITLTVNKMLTGTTVPEWDTMLYLKGTMSPQEYDQAIFRLQSPWVEKYKDETTGDVIKYDMKPQTLLVDLDPTRLFYLQEIKAFTYGANTNEIGNDKIEKFIGRELKVSPVITLNAEGDKLVEIEASKIIDAVRKYSNERSITDDVNEISVDLSIKDNPEIYDVISKLSELGSRGGLSINPTDDDGDEFDDPPTPIEEPDGTDTGTGSEDGAPGSSETDDKEKSFEKQIRMYYVLILLFAFLSETQEKTLDDVINNIDINDDNKRIAKNLGLKKEHLIAFRDSINWSVRNSLEYKIQNSDFRANDSSISPVEHIEIAINKFGKLSEAEIFTPEQVVDEIYDVFDDGFWTNLDSVKILDIASKSGNFAHGYVKEALRHGSSIEIIRDNFYSITTSGAAYEFTRKMYEALGLNIENIAQHFNSYDFIEADPDWIPSDTKFCDITKSDLYKCDKLNEETTEGDKVKFAAIVGNPPYQESTGNSRDNPIYHLFMEESYKLSERVALITPARFLFDAGQTPAAWNQKMLHDTHLKPVMFEQPSSKIFPNTDIKGGVVITYRDTNQNFGEIGTFTPFKEMNTILNKVTSSGFTSINNILYVRSSYKFTDSLYVDHPELKGRYKPSEEKSVGSNVFEKLREVFSDQLKGDPNKYIRLFGRIDNVRTYKWIRKNYIASHPNLNKWKVIIAKSNGTGTFGEALSASVLGEPGVGTTQTFITIGAFDSKDEATNLATYIKTKFCRALLGTMKVTQDNAKKSVWKNVPIQDFGVNSDIDWSQAITNIDQQLYKKYGLDEAEIAFIEERVKAME